MITLSVGQLLVLLLLMAVLVAVTGGFIHHETGNPKSHGRMAYGLALVAILTIGSAAVWGLDLPRLAWHSFDRAAHASRGQSTTEEPSSDWPGSLWKHHGRRHL
jgi:hypothetical protein